DPDNLQALTTRGKAAKASGRPDSAIMDFKRVLGLKPDYLEGYLQLADAYVMNRQFPMAKEALRKGLQRSPAQRNMLMSMYRICLLDNDYKQAELHLRALVEKYPDAISAQAKLGDFYLALNDEDAARREYSEIVLKSPRSAVGHIKLSRLYLRQGKVDNAVSQLRKGYHLVERNQSIAAELTGILIAAERFKDALALCNDRLGKNPKEAFALNLKGETFVKMKKYDQALKAFERATKIEPMWAEASNNLAAVYLQQGKIKAAVKNLKSSLDKNPKNPAAYLTLGKIYEQDKKYDKAMEIYESAIQAVPGFWTAANHLALLLCEQKPMADSLKRATELALNAYKMKPGQPAIIDTLGWIYYQKGEYQLALQLYRQIEDLIKDHHTLLNYHMAMTLLKTDHTDEAKARLRAALKDKTEFMGRSQAEKTLNLLNAST
ncbi:MAG: tetratricopeptide repeat protein, partial [Desulfobacteraceae bacterium]